MKKERKQPEEHDITEREKRAYQAKKNRPQTERPELTRKNAIIFLELVAQLQSPAIFKRKLGMSTVDINYYKRQLDVESQDEARRMLRRMQQEGAEAAEVQIAAEIRKQREAEQVAQQRLDELERIRAEKALTARPEGPDSVAIKREDAERQRRFDGQQEKAQPKSTWRLPIDPRRREDDQVEQFRRDLQYRGMTFCRDRYSVGPSDIRAEAARLGLKIAWDRIKR